MKPTVIRLLLAISLMVSGLGFILTILGATMVGFCCGSYVRDPGMFLDLIVSSGLVPLILLSGVAYLAGMILLVTCGRAPRKPDQGAEEHDPPAE